MWFRRLFGRKKDRGDAEKVNRRADREPTLDQGFYYAYMIIGLQVVFLFGIMGVIMFIGKVISTPGWVFMLMFGLFAAGIVYIYRKAKKHLGRLRELFGKTDKNYEISLLGGMLTMRIEQNPNAPKLLDAPLKPPAEAVIDAETKEPVPRKFVHQS